MLKVTPYPCCCTAFNISNFGGTDVSAGYKPSYDYDALLARLQKIIQDYGRYALVAITNDEQTVAIKALEKCGFEGSPWMEKNQHNHTRIRLWWKQPRY